MEYKHNANLFIRRNVLRILSIPLLIILNTHNTYASGGMAPPGGRIFNTDLINAENDAGAFIEMGVEITVVSFAVSFQHIGDFDTVNAHIGISLPLSSTNRQNFFKVTSGSGSEGNISSIAYEYFFDSKRTNPYSSEKFWNIGIGYQKYNDNEKLSGTRIYLGTFF